MESAISDNQYHLEVCVRERERECVCERGREKERESECMCGLACGGERDRCVKE